MKVISRSQRAGVIGLLLILVATGFVSIAFWRTTAGPDPTISPSEANHEFLERVRRGVGSQVHFAAMGDSSESVTASVDSVADFIYRRSGMRMSPETRNRVIQDETQAVNGKSFRITLSQLADLFSSLMASRLTRLSDQEIEQAATALSDPQGAVIPRANGKWGMFFKGDFIQQLKQVRTFSRSGGPAVRATVSSYVKSEFEDRGAYLSPALPQQFANLETEGVTPLQALLIVYSVAADDPLTDSQDELAKAIVQRRMNARQSQEVRKQRSGADRPYGAQGLIYAFPVGLVLDPSTIGAVLDRIEGGAGK